MQVTEFQAKLRALMESANISQSDAAKRLAVSRKTMESWLADPAKAWARPPSLVKREGILVLAKQRFFT